MGALQHTKWRREWDSNPRMLAHRRFSRPVPSTARTSLQIRPFIKRVLLYHNPKAVSSIFSQGADNFCKNRLYGMILSLDRILWYTEPVVSVLIIALGGKPVMRCPYCTHPESKVVDSRPADEGTSIRRRRECLECHKRFTT